jgi:iron complex transport system ATP-binding protein
MAPSIEVKNLTVIIDSNPILDDISFSVSEASVVALLGKNGAGKTTLLKSLAGLIPYQRGSIVINSLHLKSINKQISSKVAYLPQKINISSDILVKDFLLLGRYPILSTPFSYSIGDYSAVNSIIDLLNLNGFENRKINSLSGGEQQRVLIASALCQGATTILFDEPTTFLDPYQQEKLFEIIELLRTSKKITFVITTHDLSRKFSWSDSIISLNNSKLGFTGQSNEFFSSNAFSETFGINL